ncbi:MAG: DNA-binding GntR family transcriptional regulator [Alphaproteobacteria bacterium]|jgi:DNA-binding GntR family transcriptional regulator|tara:strand:+ start:81 stop:680 length:600 start_codon:yes stop_codon:yes gene_type:complete
MTKTNIVVEKLRSDILSGVLKEDSPLRETILAKRYNVGRAIVREGLIILSNEGLTYSKHNFGMRVSKFSNDAIYNLVIPLRRTVEIFALRQYFHKINSEDIRSWENCLKKMEKACLEKSFIDIVEWDIEFHRLIVERSNIVDVISIWNLLIFRVKGHFMRNYHKYTDTMEIYYEHDAILSMFRTGKLESAIQILESNIE